ncbi:phosphoribosylglycinamide formyltransferase [Sedimenticola sp.]|uniref:phosphoribosylglycinamide formyltransferase n=1 Tax=Sedimenticola sp. TaxID=1940285 RepID=UPI0025898188|nr:phosphoribosylglycinamide formyltransferase [Sedimenticola sp.]MCW8903142.1 phosphoribosylglycinamide formyltransferase [Sedimenticola sp.]
MTEQRKLPIVVLLSGSGSNLQAIIDGAADDLPVEIRGVISNRGDAFGLERARQASIPTRVLDHTDYPDRETYDQALMELIDSYQPALVVLAGFMRILTPGFVTRYQGRLLNIHPSLLPKYRGLHTHQRALEAGDRVHGASVHLVTEELDGGPVILQVRVPVEPGDDEATLAARVLTQEHRIYPAVIRWFAEGRLKVTQGFIELDGKTLREPKIMEFNQVSTE